MRPEAWREALDRANRAFHEATTVSDARTRLGLEAMASVEMSLAKYHAALAADPSRHPTTPAPPEKAPKMRMCQICGGTPDLVANDGFSWALATLCTRPECLAAAQSYGVQLPPRFQAAPAAAAAAAAAATEAPADPGVGVVTPPPAGSAPAVAAQTLASVPANELGPVLDRLSGAIGSFWEGVARVVELEKRIATLETAIAGHENPDHERRIAELEERAATATKRLADLEHRATAATNRLFELERETPRKATHPVASLPEEG